MKFKIQIVFILFLPLIAFAQANTNYTLKVLGVVQDGGLPHLGSNKLCCDETQSKRHVTSLMLINNKNNYSYLFDASPDINEQLNFMGDRIKKDLKGIFLTHAHIGHYTGLMYFGREALNSKSINVYAMPRMKKFLENNGPWSQLVSLENILITELNNNSKISVDSNVIIQPFEVPHRPEFSETVGYKIYGPNKKALFIPDIDKWYLWDKSIIDEIKNNPSITYDEMLKIFLPGKEGTAGHKWGVIQKKEYGMKVLDETGHKRFYLKDNEILKISDAEIVVCNQWGAGNIQGFLDLCNKLDISISLGG